MPIHRRDRCRRLFSPSVGVKVLRATQPTMEMHSRHRSRAGPGHWLISFCSGLAGVFSPCANGVAVLACGAGALARAAFSQAAGCSDARRRRVLVVADNGQQLPRWQRSPRPTRLRLCWANSRRFFRLPGRLWKLFPAVFCAEEDAERSTRKCAVARPPTCRSG